jgi:hypothetical protein
LKKLREYFQSWKLLKKKDSKNFKKFKAC